MDLLNPPPADVVVLPRTIRDLLDKLVAARGRAGSASSINAWLIQDAIQDDKTAAVADERHAVEAARAGTTGSLTPHADALAARRAEAADAVKSTAALVTALEGDLRDAIEALRASGTLAATTEKTTKAFAAAVDNLRAALTAQAQARAVEAWAAGAPYKVEATVDIQRLAPSIRGQIGPQILHIAPCDIFDAIDAIAHYTD